MDENIYGSLVFSIAESRETSIGSNDLLTVGKNLVVNVGDSITLRTGDASISMNQNGTIVITGANITFEGSGKISIRASAEIVMKGSKILQN